MTIIPADVARWHRATAQLERGVRLHDLTDAEIVQILSALTPPPAAGPDRGAVARILKPMAFDESYARRRTEVWGSFEEAKAYQEMLRKSAFAKADAILSALEPRGDADGEADGWIVANGAGDQFRTWEGGFASWTPHRASATRYARRRDAENVHTDDEDAWRVEPYAGAPDAEG